MKTPCPRTYPHHAVYLATCVSRLDTILARVVTDGRVDYDAIDDDAMQATVEDIARADLAAMSRDGEYAFLINAYNALALHLARRVGSLRRPWTWLRFFLGSRVTVAGRRMSLYRLEAGLIKPHLRRDPRGHFALVCASTGCPPLRGGIYHEETLDEELEAAGKAFLRPGVGYRRDGDTVHVTRILKWYRKDFEALGGTHAVLARFGAPEDQAWLAGNPRVRFMKYDWSRNEA